MALDFPLTPVPGALYRGSNGVVYQYNSTYGVWLAVSSNIAPPVDFTAAGTPTFASTAAFVPALTTIISGNSGGWYSTGNGRFTPPAGRYCLFAFWSHYATGGANQINLTARKNGAAITPNFAATSAAASYPIEVSFALNVDANGTDYFDILVQSGSYPGVAINIVFGAFALAGGAQPPPASYGTSWRQLGRVVPTAGQASVDFVALPSDINDIEFRWDIQPATNAVNLVLQVYGGSGALDTTAGDYSWAQIVALYNQNGTAPSVYGSAAGPDNARIILTQYPTGANNASLVDPVGGRATINNIRDATRGKDFTWQCHHHNGSYLVGITGTASRRVADAITGLRLSWGTGNFAAGGAVTLWGSP